MPPTEEQLEELEETGSITYSNGETSMTYTSGNGGIRENGPTPMLPLSPLSPILHPFSVIHETLLDFRPLGSWIIFERHIIKGCTCSHCCGFMEISGMINGSNQSKLLKYLRVRFNSPTNKARNSWRRITLKGFKYYYYLKWTLPHAELIAKKVMKIIGEE